MPEFGDYRELLDLGSLDAVVVSTPPAIHEAISLAGMAKTCEDGH